MRHLVVGPRIQDGVAPGGTVTIDDDKRARRLVRAGHLAPVDDQHVCEHCGRDDFKSARGLAQHARACKG